MYLYNVDTHMFMACGKHEYIIIYSICDTYRELIYGPTVLKLTVRISGQRVYSEGVLFVIILTRYSLDVTFF